MEWQFLDSGKASPEHHMAVDAELLNGLSKTGQPVLRFYEWDSASATYGYFIEPENFLNLDGVRKRGLRIARRPTGGGIVFHTCDLAFSILVPAAHPAFSLNTLENYAFVNRAVATTVKVFLGNREMPQLLPAEPYAPDKASESFCMAKPTKYDVMLDGRKVGGGAQRRTKHGFLHQGTISLAMPPADFLQDVLLPHTEVLASMQRNSYMLLGDTPTPAQLAEAKQQLMNLLRDIMIKDQQYT